MAPKTESKVAAREQLEQNQDAPDPTARLEEQAKEQEKTQAQELSAGAKAPKGEHDKLIDQGNVAGARNVGTLQSRTVDAVDNFGARSADDALQGLFVEIDLKAKGVKAAYEAAGIPDHTGAFGVFTTVGETDPKTGYPLTIGVRLRDATHTTVTIPYEAARRTDRVSR